MILTFLATFFNSPALGVVCFLLIADWVSGLTKAGLTKTLVSHRVLEGPEKTLRYLLIYAVLHSLTLLMTSFGIVEYFTLAAMAFKEGLSVLENLMAIEKARGIEDSITAKIVEVLGLNLDNIMSHLKIKSKEQE